MRAMTSASTTRPACGSVRSRRRQYFRTHVSRSHRAFIDPRGQPCAPQGNASVLRAASHVAVTCATHFFDPAIVLQWKQHVAGPEISTSVAAQSASTEHCGSRAGSSNVVARASFASAEGGQGSDGPVEAAAGSSALS